VSRRRAHWLLLALTAGALVGCGQAPRPNLVLVTIESLRTDHVGAYGGRARARPEVPITPHLDAFAARAIRFEDAHAVSSWTLTAHASLFTGLEPNAHRTVLPLDRLPDSYPTLAEALAAAGYQTAGVVSGPYLRRAHNLSQGFELWDDGISSLTSKLAHDDVTNPAMEKALVRFVESERDPARPLFLFAYFWDPHYDFLPPPPYDTMFQGPDAQPFDASRFELNPAIHPGMPAAQLAYVLSQYAGEIRWTDEHLGRFFALLERHGLWENTAILVTADHGEEFFEHGQKGHKNNLYAETIHVPLLLKLPHAREGRVDRRLAGQVDVLPTLLELAGVAADFPQQGRSLLEPDPPALRSLVFDLLASWYFQRPGAPQRTVTERWRGVREGAWKLVWREAGGSAPPLRRLYDAARDPEERDDRADANPEHVRLLESLYEAQRVASERIAEAHPRDGSAQLSERELESLRALGYLDP
jgi:arylsulfatase A-like enzyme